MRTLTSFFILLFLTATAFPMGLTTPSGEKVAVYPYSKDQVWSACLQVLKGLPLESADLEKGKIKTEWWNRQVVEKGFSLLGSAKEVRSQFFISLKEKNPNQTVVRIFSRQEMQKFSGQQSLRHQPVPSDGAQETQFLENLSARLRELYEEKK